MRPCVEFLGSHVARNIRILCELEETSHRLHQNKVQGTILFFGSARARSTAQFDFEVKELEDKIASSEEGSKESIALKERLEVLKSLGWMCAPYETIVDLSRRLSLWGLDPSAHRKPYVTGRF